MLPLAWHRRTHTGRWILCAVAAGLVLVASTAPSAQEQVKLYVLATDQTGTPVTDLTAADFAYTEKGQAGQIVSVERHSLPVRITLIIDNGSDSSQIMGNFRTGLEGFFKELPEDIEVSVISMAPQPRTVLQFTNNREQIVQAVNRIGIDNDNPRFSDALYEYTQRIEKSKPDFIPVLLMLSSTGNEASSVQPAQLEQGLKTLMTRQAPVYVLNTVHAQNNTNALEALDRGRQKIIGEMYAKATGGHYEGITVQTNVHDMLPGLALLLADMHKKNSSQLLVTINRPAGFSGQLTDINFRITRPGLTGSVTGDGRVR